MNDGVILFYILFVIVTWGGSGYALWYALRHGKSSPWNKEKRKESTPDIQAISGRRAVYFTGEENERAIAEYLLRVRRDYESGLFAAVEQNKMEIALKMISRGIPTQEIADITGLTEKQIHQIEKS